MAIVIAIGATHQIAIGDNGASIGAIYCRHWRQWRQMLHSPNYLTLLPKTASIQWVLMRVATRKLGDIDRGRIHLISYCHHDYRIWYCSALTNLELGI